METRSAKKRKLLIFYNNNNNNEEEEPGNDYISELPDAVLHHILFLVPIKTAAQTSVLSKRWRSLWSTFPDLDFTTFNPNGSRKSHSRPPNYARGIDFITQILTLRNKQSDIRVLRFLGPFSFSRLNGLIRSAVRHNVQELDVDVATGDYLNFPRCVVASKSLRVFKMRSRPGFRLPPASVMKGGFQSLQSLSLSLIYNQPSLSDLFSDSSFPLLKKLSLDACSGLQNLNVGCRALEDLSLEKCSELRGLEISCAKLERLRVASCFDAKIIAKSWVKIEAPKARSVVWECNGITDSCFMVDLSGVHEASVGFSVLKEHLSVAKLDSVSNLLMGFSHVRCLTLESQCVELLKATFMKLNSDRKNDAIGPISFINKILSNYNYFAVYLQPFNNLESLELHTGFNKNNVPGLACILRSSPLLQTLILKIINDYKIERRKWNKDLWDMSSTEEEQYWESQTETLKSFLRNLKVVKIHGFLECENEVSLAKFLLKHGKALEEMTLCTGRCKARDSLRRQKIRSQIMGFSWASSNAKITIQ